MKTRELYLFILLLLALPALSSPDQSAVASLIVSLKELPDDTNKLKQLSALVDSLPDGQWQILNRYYRDVSYKMSQDADPKIRWKSLQSYAESLSSEGADYVYQGDYKKALDLFYRSEKISLEINEVYSLSMVVQNIAAVYDRFGDNEKALYNYKRALHFEVASKNTVAMILTLSNIGVLYKKLNNSDSCLSYARQAYELALQDNFSSHESGGIITRLGSAYHNLGQSDKATIYFTKGLEISKQMNDLNGISDSYYGLATLAAENGNIDNAIDLAISSLRAAQKRNTLQPVNMSAALLRRLYIQKGNFEKAYRMTVLEIESRDSLNKIENEKAVIRNQLQREYDLKEATAKLVQEKKDVIVQKELQKHKLVRNGFVGGFSVVLLFAGVFLYQRNRISKAKKRSDELLLNILPEEVAEELKAKGNADAKHYEQVTILFTDFKNFTETAEKLSAQELVNRINYCYSEFDKIVMRNGIEKIKTIGDAYMCAGGLPVINTTNAVDTIRAALEIRDFMLAENLKSEKEGNSFFEIRIGCHTGPVVAGIVGINKFAYDIWGDAVNIAARMEQNSASGKINISGATYELVKDKFKCVHRGKISAKNKGEIDMYFVESVL